MGGWGGGGELKSSGSLLCSHTCLSQLTQSVTGLSDELSRESWSRVTLTEPFVSCSASCVYFGYW